MDDNFFILQIAGVLSFAFLVACWWLARKRCGAALDAFMLLFSIQYGPHGLWVTSFHRLADLISPRDTELFLVGMNLAYLGLAAGMMSIAFVSFRWLADRPFPLQANSDLLLALIATAYIVPFVALQGPALPITSEYLRAFMGTSMFDYDQIRREMFTDAAYTKLASLTRQTSTALLFSFMIRRCLQNRLSMFRLFPFMAALFVLCALQMNKFPFVYYFMLVVVTYLGLYRAQDIKDFLRKSSVLAAGAVVAIIILIALYRFQYDRTTSEVQEVLIYRIFYCSCDGLRLWYDYFPAKEEFLQLRGIPITAALTGQTYVNPTVVIPDSLMTGRITSYQAGFIGSGYACYGLFGIVIYSFLAAVLITFMGIVQRVFRDDDGATSFLVILTMNSIFITTRELHTALLSGGTLSMLLVFFAIHYLNPLRLRKRIA